MVYPVYLDTKFLTRTSKIQQVCFTSTQSYQSLQGTLWAFKDLKHFRRTAKPLCRLILVFAGQICKILWPGSYALYLSMAFSLYYNVKERDKAVISPHKKKLCAIQRACKCNKHVQIRFKSSQTVLQHSPVSL